MHSPSIYAACVELTHTYTELWSGDTNDNACQLRCHELQRFWRCEIAHREKVKKLSN